MLRGGKGAVGLQGSPVMSVPLIGLHPSAKLSRSLIMIERAFHPKNRPPAKSIRRVDQRSSHIGGIYTA